MATVLLAALAGRVSGVASVATVRAAPLAQPPGPEGEPPLAEALGVNVDFLAPGSGDAARRTRAMDWLVRNGITLVRQPVRWSEIEPVEGRPDWSSLDSLAAELAARDLRWIATLETAPDWARRDPAPPAHWMLCRAADEISAAEAVQQPPSDPADLARFAAALAERYADGLAAIEIWREPNLLPRWRVAGPDPEDYARLLVPVARAIEAAAPRVQRLSAGLAPTRELGVCALSDLVFLDRLARTGALEAVNGVGALPFGLRDPPGPLVGERERLDLARVERLQEVLEAHAIALPIWALAWGWRIGDAQSPWGGHPPETAAAWTRYGWALARDAWPQVGPMLLWHLDPPVSAENPLRGFALLDLDGTPTALGLAAADIAVGRVAPLDALPDPVAGGADAADDAGARLPAARRWSPVLLLLAAAVALAVVGVLHRGRARWARALRVSDARWARRSPLQLTMAYGLGVSVALLAPWPLATAALPLLAVLAVGRPGLALAAVPAVAPFWYALRLSLGPRAVAPVEGLLAVALFGVLVRAWLSSGSTGARTGAAGRGLAWRATSDGGVANALSRAILPRGPWFGTVLDMAVLLLLLWGALSLLWVERPALALQEWRRVLFGPALFYGLLRLGAPERRLRVARWAMMGFVLGAAVAALWSLVELLRFALGQQAAIVAVEGVLRARGPYASPNNLALLLGRAIPVAVAAALWAAGRTRSLARVTVVPLLLAWLATFSRGALLFGLPPTLLLLGILAGLDRSRGTAEPDMGGPTAWRWPAIRRAGLIVGAGLVLTAVLLAPFAGSARLSGALRLDPGSTGYIRLALWRSAGRMALDHPWLGVGPDQFLGHYAERYVERGVVQERFLNHPHQLVLDWWTRLGLPGLLALVVFTGAQGAAFLVAWRRGPPETRWLCAAAGGLLVYALGHGLVDNHFFLVDLALAAWMAQAALLAVVGAIEEGSRAPVDTKSDGRRRARRSEFRP